MVPGARAAVVLPVLLEGLGELLGLSAEGLELRGAVLEEHLEGFAGAQGLLRLPLLRLLLRGLALRSDLELQGVVLEEPLAGFEGAQGLLRLLLLRPLLRGLALQSDLLGRDLLLDDGLVLRDRVGHLLVPVAVSVVVVAVVPVRFAFVLASVVAILVVPVWVVVVLCSPSWLSWKSLW